ncbi:MAG: hypothetical protein SCI25_00360 [Desulfuromonadales bacterium]|nr:hypothetical protein [Desulfuromonadales bacterium]MDW7758070.1 hypothetical protein [Desulfuromonadales bacterium]
MKNLYNALLSILIFTGSAFAAGPAIESQGILIPLFIGFAALILLNQFVPGLLRLTSLFKGVSHTSINRRVN